MAMVDWIYAQPRGTCNEHTKEVFEETGEGDGGEANIINTSKKAIPQLYQYLHTFP
jgi:hypothetical protein